MKPYSATVVSWIIACIILQWHTGTLIAQSSLMHVDKESLYQLPGHLVKNNSLTVISDRSFEQSGLILHEIGFRKSPNSDQLELLVQFKADSGFETNIGFHLFGEDRHTLWQDSIKRIDQPQEANLISMIVRPKFPLLPENAVLYLWARSPVKKNPYEIWEWMDIGPSEWIVPLKDTQTVSSNRFLLKEDSSIVYTALDVDINPVFNHNGESEIEYIMRKIRYPEDAKKENIQGVVYMMFVVSPDGSVRDIEIVQDIGGGCGQEASRVIQSMPRWQPGTVNEKAVPVKVVIPIRFKL